MSKESLRVLAGAYRPAEQIAADMVQPPPSVDWVVEGPRLLDALREIAAIHPIGLNAATGTLGWGALPRAAVIALAAIIRATPGGETGT